MSTEGVLKEWVWREYQRDEQGGSNEGMSGEGVY